MERQIVGRCARVWTYAMHSRWLPLPLTLAPNLASPSAKTSHVRPGLGPHSWRMIPSGCQPLGLSINAWWRFHPLQNSCCCCLGRAIGGTVLSMKPQRGYPSHGRRRRACQSCKNLIVGMSADNCGIQRCFRISTQASLPIVNESNMLP